MKCIHANIYFSECNEASSVVNTSLYLCVLCRWARSSTEEDFHQMGEFSLGPSDLPNRRLIHRPARWPHAYPPSGSALRRTAGQYHTATQNVTLVLSMTSNLHKLWGSRTHVLNFLFFQHEITCLVFKIHFPSYCLHFINLNYLIT